MEKLEAALALNACLQRQLQEKTEKLDVKTAQLAVKESEVDQLLDRFSDSH